MLEELRVRDLGVVDDVTLQLGVGMTVVTGETGAGKTMLVEAIRLLLGAKTQAHLVRAGASEAVVEGRFLTPTWEVVVRRVVATEGKSRGYLDGNMASAATLAETGEELVDVHGQHSHQRLLSPQSQRVALDAYGGIELDELLAARAAMRELVREQEALGGDERMRARELDLARFERDEIDAARIESVDEDESLQRESEALSTVASRRLSLGVAHELLAHDGGVAESLGEARKALGDSLGDEFEARLTQLNDEVIDLTHELALRLDGLTDDPERNESIQERRAVLANLRRKYGPTLEDVLRYRDRMRDRVEELVTAQSRAATVEADIAATLTRRDAIARKVRAQRVKAAREFETVVEKFVAELAMPHVRFRVEFPDEREDLAADDVRLVMSSNPGMPMLPIAKAASGGELARVMLAIRLACHDASAREDHLVDDSRPARTVLFDEVDAGVGGQAALAVGRALRRLAHVEKAQVLVVTHLPQVAAFADHHIVVEKTHADASTVSRARSVTGADRTRELARMLSGHPDSKAALHHARELLAESAS